MPRMEKTTVVAALLVQFLGRRRCWDSRFGSVDRVRNSSGSAFGAEKENVDLLFGQVHHPDVKDSRRAVRQLQPSNPE